MKMNELYSFMVSIFQRRPVKNWCRSHLLQKQSQMNRSITLRNQTKKGRFQLAEFLQVLPRRLVLLVLNHLIFIAAHALRLQTV